MTNSVVVLEDLTDGVVQVSMQDKENKNTFSEGIIAGLTNAFHAISQREDISAVVLTGYDSYFSGGGAQEGLRDLYEGKFQFTDKDLYSLSLNCPVPVVDAMQGHGIGGGFVMGLFADFVVLSRESIYTTNFMKYGFTLDMGSTMILPQKLGLGLAREMMLNAQNFRGEELKQRGISFPVLARSEVLPYAIARAKELAKKTRVSLVTLKDVMVGKFRQKLSSHIEKDVEIHELTFHRPEVKTRIDTVFGR
ncbi:polyketide synthase [Teredinibacter haidensis]|uniref:polyketide synthase n=1 Tax=Teredinibacter haidensis TaxID=2731755 RepID=UPI000948B191|nr:polyketide synthase [Teredinibacter haidensis]